MRLSRSKLTNIYVFCLLLSIANQAQYVASIAISFASSSSALKIVQTMASVVAAPPNSQSSYKYPIFRDRDGDRLHHNNYNSHINDHALEGLGGPLYTENGNTNVAEVSILTRNGVSTTTRTTKSATTDDTRLKEIPMSFGLSSLKTDSTSPKEQIWTALSRLESNSK